MHICHSQNFTNFLKECECFFFILLIGYFGIFLGEFLLVLAAIEAQTGQTFTTAEVLHKFKVYLTVMSKDKFYFSTDSSAVTHFKGACGCPQLNIADPPDVRLPVLFVFFFILFIFVLGHY
jgi:hypothetical protein